MAFATFKLNITLIDDVILSHFSLLLYTLKRVPLFFYNKALAEILLRSEPNNIRTSVNMIELKK